MVHAFHPNLNQVREAVATYITKSSLLAHHKAPGSLRRIYKGDRQLECRSFDPVIKIVSSPDAAEELLLRMESVAQQGQSLRFHPIQVQFRFLTEQKTNSNRTAKTDN